MKTSDSIASEIILASLDRLPPPPVDLEAVARYIGVAEVIRLECRAGFTVFDGPGPVVHIGKLIPHAKSRFIIAHELAHVMLRLPRVLSLIQNRGRAELFADEEGLADSIAQTLLIPDAWVESFRAPRVTLKDILSFSRKADVSPQALIRRMAASRIDLAMLQWRKVRLSWAVIDRPGVSSYLHGCLNPTFAGYWALEHVEIEESSLLVDCYLNEKHVIVVGTGVRQGSDVLQLVRPSHGISAAINGAEDWFKEKMKMVMAFDNYDRR